MSNQWISVKDKMPERYPEEPELSVTVMVRASEQENLEYGFFTFACYSERHQDWLENEPLESMGFIVTHWQPAPEPPIADVKGEAGPKVTPH